MDRRGVELAAQRVHQRLRRVRGRRRDEQVRVVTHQRVGVQRAAVQAAELAQALQVRLTRNWWRAALHQVQRHARQDDAGKTAHSGETPGR
jgi:hypothetical protein